VEEWVDRRFFRPLGLRVARALAPTAASPDQVTLTSVAVGLVAGHLCWYGSPWINLTGVILFVLSDVFDSADGQLARMRGTSTRLGRALDGIADNVRFANLYLHLMSRAMLAGPDLLPLFLTLGAGAAHSLQSSVADHLRQAYLYVTRGGGELDLPEDVTIPPASAPRLRRLQAWVYRRYAERQARLCRKSVEVIRRIRSGRPPARVAERWAVAQEGPVRQCAWIGQNIRFGLLALTVIPGWPLGFLWATGGLSLAMGVIVVSHERRAAALLESA